MKFAVIRNSGALVRRRDADTIFAGSVGIAIQKEMRNA